ncbi:bromodomain-containing protein 4-like isoform X2 [Selaginella moellendorffii]|uniref:bromodomain-containing protein 4-like isoform X2 n=1 Tax=Selaginella moellendorffii TaxID=88036 RepID=UPI000D1CB525|nr:bromodomain-containing protein 4-like isoform X2 [Selaginella moellendorffii]|eukprot:XP_024519354.1 bromodomain-containing protein 4-like isoform X2 [Selaginella moellendorffii]
MVHAWLWPNPSSALALGCIPSPPQQQALGRGRRAGIWIAAAKRQQWEDVWEPRQVTLDKADLMQLEMRRMLGESRDLSIAKVVAKKLNPSATNLEVEKIVKQKGVKTFLSLVVKESDLDEDREAAIQRKDEAMDKSRSEAPPPVMLPPRPSFGDGAASPPPRRQAGGFEFEWPREADELRKNLEDDYRDFSRPDIIQLSPKPRGGSSTTPRVGKPLVPRLPSSDAQRTSPGKAKAPEKPAPELHSRPSRGGGAKEMFPVAGITPQQAPPPPKKLPVPSLSSRPAIPQPAPPSHQQEHTPANAVQEKPDLHVPELTLRPTMRLPTPPAEPEQESKAPPQTIAMQVPSLTSRPEMPAPTSKAEHEAQQQMGPDLTGVPIPEMTPPATIQEVEDLVKLEKEPDLTVSGLAPRPEVRSSKLETKEHSDNPASTRQDKELRTPSLTSRPALRPLTPPAADEFSAGERPTSGQEIPVPSLSAKPAVPVSEKSEAADSFGEGKAIPGGVDSGNGSAAHLESSSPQPAKVDLDAVQAKKPAPRLVQETVAETPDQEEIDKDWALAEVALDTRAIQDVLFIGSNAGGMIVRFGHLNGFVPGKDLLESRGLKTFRAWARERGHDANHTSILDSSSSSESTFAVSKMSNQGLTGEVESHLLHPACDSDLDRVYREERLSFLSSLVGQRAKVTVTYVDKAKKKLVFSERKAALEDPEVTQRRADLMAKLKTGDIVKGRVRNISLFGVFVELVEGVSGLMHFSELSWTPVPDPAKFVNVGQEIETAVHKLDYDRQRIYLSLKRMSPDPLLETVESMLARQEDVNSNSATDPQILSIPELEALLKRLESRQEIQEIAKGRRVHSASVVPTFQVYLSSAQHDEAYKLLARSGNEVQEVLLRTSLERSTLKSIISEYTTSVQEETI